MCEKWRLVDAAVRGAVESAILVGAPRGAAKLLRARYLDRLVPVDELLPTLYCRRADAPGLARDDLDALYADAPRLAALAVRPSLVWERRGLSDTEASGEVNCK